MDQIPGGDLTGWAAMLASVAGGFLWLRRYLTGDAVDRAVNKVAADTIAMLQAQLSEAHRRNDLLMQSLDQERVKYAQAHAKINELTAHVFQLEIQVRGMRQKLEELAPGTDTLANGPTP